MRDAAIRLRTTLVSLYFSFRKVRYTIGREYLLGCVISIEMRSYIHEGCQDAKPNRKNCRRLQRRPHLLLQY